MPRRCEHAASDRLRIGSFFSGHFFVILFVATSYPSFHRVRLVRALFRTVRSMPVAILSVGARTGREGDPTNQIT